MSDQADRVTPINWRLCAIAKFKRPRYWGALVVGLGITLLTIGWPHVWRVLESPLWQGGIFLVAVLAAILVLSWWETRPKRGRRLPPDADDGDDAPPPITEEERRLVQDVRTVWERKGREAVTHLKGIFSDAKYVFGTSDRGYWKPALLHYESALETATKDLDKALAGDSRARIKEVRDAFNNTHDAYMRIARWVAVMSIYEGVELEHRSLDERLLAWRADHRAFFDKAADLVTDPLHDQTLKVFLRPETAFDPVHQLLLRWLQEGFEGEVPTLSAYRIAALPRPKSEEEDPEK